MSKEICEYDKIDDRYQKSVEYYNKDNNQNIEVIKIYREALVDVHKFDIFFDEFENIISSIVSDCGENVEILCNVSSGTPAMKSTLQIMVAFSKYKLIPIQVYDPSKGKFKRDVDLLNYNVEEYWKQNINNTIDQNRTYISKNDTFYLKMQKEMMINLIKSYDYEAAYQFVQSYIQRIDSKVATAILLAKERYNLYIKTIIKLNKEFHLLPYEQKNEIELFEYSLWLKIKLNKGEIVDFLRGLNSFMYTACIQILNNKFNINIYNYCNKKNSTYYLVRNKLCKDETGNNILKILDKSYANKYMDTYLTEKQMLQIIYTMLDNDLNVKICLKELNKLREEKRNIASHQIVCIKEKDIIDGTGKNIKNYINDIKTILAYLGYDVKKHWDSYEDMNKYIIDKLKEKKNEV
jgi:hypothetical protein